MALFGRFFKWGTRSTRSTSSVPPGTCVYAVGDIHGRCDLLRRLHAAIVAHAETGTATRRVLVYIGDYVDRGPDSREVIDLLLDEPIGNFETIHLMGNHERMLLQFLERPALGRIWLNLGGRETLASYRVPLPRTVDPTPDEFRRIHDEFCARLPPNHLTFLRGLRTIHVEGDYLFAHAGIRPGVPIEHQDFEDILSIREPFLTSTSQHGKVVVHGHSITPAPEIRHNRIGIDTGAFASGRLTCAILRHGAPDFLTTGTN